MAAYLIIEVDVHDATQYETYRSLTAPSLRFYDGKFIVRGGATETLEGDWDAKRIVVLEFPTKEKAKQWWSSEEYAPAKVIRQRSATTKIILVEGA